MKTNKKIKRGAYKNQYEKRDSGGRIQKNCLNLKKLGDKEISFFKPKEGKNRFNIIPYIIKSKNHPSVHSQILEIGDLDYALDIFVHRNIGPDEVTVLCPKKTYGKTCPICTYVSQLYEEGKKDEAKAIQASNRSFFNVQPIQNGEAGPLQIFEVSHYLFTKYLIEEANECGNGEDILPFADLEEGKIVHFRMEIENKIPRYSGFKFLPREDSIKEEVIEQAISFDDLLVTHTPEELEAILYGKPIEKDDEEEEEEKPVSKKKKIEKDDEEEEEIEKDEEEEEPKNQKRNDSDKKGTGPECPYGHEWGEADNHKECRKCDKWDQCDDEN